MTDFTALDEIDRKLLDIVQSDFPLEHRPYEIIGQKVGLSEQEVLARINFLRKRGIIRRLGANFQSKKLGFVSTLCAAKVPEDKLNFFIERVNKEIGVTHNYHRCHEYNIWFTLIAPSIQRRNEILEDIMLETGINILSLPATKLYKIKVDFPMM